MNVIGNIRGFLDLVAWSIGTHQISFKKETLNGCFIGKNTKASYQIKTLYISARLKQKN